MKTILKIVLTVALFAVSAKADTLVLKDGRQVTGTLQSTDGRQIKMLVGDKVESFSILDAVSLFFGDAPPAAVSASPSTSAPAAGLLPAGTVITVRTIDAIDSQKAQQGQVFRASLDEPVIVNNQTIAAKGADAFLKLVAVKQSGKITGAAEISVAVDNVMINGSKVPVSTENVTSASDGRGTKSAEVIGGGAALGALIGGLTKGGKGAAVGAAAGAGAGTAVQLATKGQRVSIPAETRLSFTVGNGGN